MTSERESIVRGGLQLWQIASGRFVQVAADWTVERARAAIDLFPRAFAVVRDRAAPEETYWLLTPGEARSLLAEGAGSVVGEVLAVAEIAPVPALDAPLDVEEAPDVCVVLEKGEPVGISHPDQDIPDIQRGPGDDGAGFVSRLLVAEFERRVPLGKTLTLLLSLAESVDSGEENLPLALPLGTKVDLLVYEVEGFEILGEREASLVVSSEPKTLPVRFRLQPTRLGSGRIEILAFHGSQCLGRLSLAPVVIERSEASGPIVCYETGLATPGPEPDLTLEIRETGAALQRQLRLRLISAKPGRQVKSFDPIPLELNPSLYISDLFRDMEALEGADARQQETATRRLAARGADLFESIFPEDLRVLLWSLRSQIRTLHISSEEPWIPWELCRLVGRDENGMIVEGKFFCEQFAMARWPYGTPLKPTLSLQRIALIVPGSSGLSAAGKEREERLGIGDGERRVEPIPCRYVDVASALASGSYDGLNLAGHGLFRGPDPNRSRLELDDGDELAPWDLRGEIANLGRATPLVFLNACQAGRADFSMTKIGGWGPRFLGAGAAAFIAPYWSIRDQAAGAFARAFYRHLLAGEPIGEAARSARLEVREAFPGNPTWLAYTVFADPLARIASAEDRARPRS